jgi:hypothetical protein
MAYRNKTYICFDGDTDMKYYRMMQAWDANEHFEFEFHNAHDLNTARDTSQVESIKRQLRIRFANSKLLVVLIGERTKFLRRFVQWEMEVALGLPLPIIGVNLNGKRDRDDDRCPPAIRDELVVYTSFGAKIINYAMKSWPDEFSRLRKQGIKGPRHYAKDVYTNLGIQ